MTMEHWSKKLDSFLTFNERELLTHSGKVVMEIAQKLALERYDLFDLKRKQDEAELADLQDIKELEMIEKKHLQRNE